MILPYLEAGKAVTTHGVRGEVKLEIWCGDAALLKTAPRLYRTAGGGGPLELVSLRGTGEAAIARFAGVDTMEAARALVGQVFYFDRRDVRLPAGVWFIADLLGCEVRDADTGRVYGTVKSIEHPGPQDIYTVVTPEGKEYRFPGVKAFLREQNPEAGYLLVTPIPGLLDDDAVTDGPDGQEEL
jgi:16S rRNA processing protein RimM